MPYPRVTQVDEGHSQVAPRRIPDTHLPTVDGRVDVTFAVEIVLLADEAVDTVFNNHKTQPHPSHADHTQPELSVLAHSSTAHTPRVTTMRPDRVLTSPNFPLATLVHHNSRANKYVTQRTQPGLTHCITRALILGTKTNTTTTQLVIPPLLRHTRACVCVRTST
jgi:hypothetical protein